MKQEPQFKSSIKQIEETPIRLRLSKPKRDKKAQKSLLIETHAAVKLSSTGPMGQV